MPGEAVKFDVPKAEPRKSNIRVGPRKQSTSDGRRISTAPRKSAPSTVYKRGQSVMSNPVRETKINELVDQEIIDSLQDSQDRLTETQISAFREAFEIFDRNGGGSIDATELLSTLQEYGINLDEDEINEVMMTMDGDGNGEVDFEEFLSLMTDTEMFIEALALKRDGAMVSNRVILFDALTEFMKKQALNNAQEIVGYYAKKYRKVAKKIAVGKAAHVVGHYAESNRLIGLTDGQLFKQLKRIRAGVASNDSKDSPYATSNVKELLQTIRDKPQLTPRKPYVLGGARLPHLSRLKHLTKVPMIVAVEKPKDTTAKIRLKFVGTNQTQPILPQRLAVLDMNTGIPKRQRSNMEARGDRPLYHLPGWLPHRALCYDVEIPMSTEFSDVYLDQLPRLRMEVDEAVKEFESKVDTGRYNKNISIYRSLNTRPPRTCRLQKQVYRSMIAYSSATMNDRSGKTSMTVLAKIFNEDRKVKPIITRQTAFGPPKRGLSAILSLSR
ncbi:Oidioi.mRNA.OKI2018_I69.PAR.g10502.t1.cds [Oikopleura dioica]|uniref:Oidioi.mRNA.OKI2018_I69.PAR.g10502.t1.cds n=1 Tax=Oikopleura dioica TaxID=34765 RepID=A0ABN7RW47_OIKDI|nr:Oidioi.mRNA.OKI2018_I69.PAR.g10502.t1.cds [Oikopleura dioica]